MLFAAPATPMPVLGIFYPGETAGFFLIFMLGLLIYVFSRRAGTGKRVPSIRKIPGLESIDEAIGRATEMGKAVHYSIGIGGVTHADTIASWPILEYVARTCAKYDTKLVQTNRNYLVYGVCDEIIKQAYVAVGKPESYNPNDVRWYSDSQWGYSTAVLGYMNRDKPSTNFMFGSFAAETLLLAEAGAVLGCMQIAGTTNILQIPFFVATCDYTLLGEELYAASAYISKDPVLVGTVVAQDIMKMLIAAVTLVGGIFATFKADKWLKNLFAK
ncbi:MAG: hypothetical protein GX784_02705 [Firmicutes bacterium]|nr:hypothetical protein [Candidatus Fermentithermobacillaceae bacterium]